ncbi:MAG TPA: histidine phosphatase family protein [Anaerolineales bacterium]|jgi:probable phosphoglycerate mutase|nr:histidine phosphatase family protein [Anaerolineales bacterium]
MTTRLYLIRHGATPLSTEDRFSGAANVFLSEEGHAQVERLARRLADDNIAAVYTSPLDRTIDTAKIIAQPHGLTPIPQDGLREISHGHWEGMTRKEVEEKFSEEYSSWEADPFTFAPEGGESGISVLARALPVVREIVVTHKDRNIAVVSHKATIRLILSSLLGFDERGYRDRLDQAPACLNILDFKNSVQARLMLFNDISHYADHPHRAEKHLSRWWDLSNTSETGTD